MILITGPRRPGKTSDLIAELKKDPMGMLLVFSKHEALRCREVFGLHHGQVAWSSPEVLRLFNGRPEIRIYVDDFDLLNCLPEEVRRQVVAVTATVSRATDEAPEVSN